VLKEFQIRRAVLSGMAASATTDVIEAARVVVKDTDPYADSHRIPTAEINALDAALKAYDARRAEMSAMPITGGG
jgi:hypothetical protein